MIMLNLENHKKKVEENKELFDEIDKEIGNKVEITKFMTEIVKYPNGKTYVRSWLVNQELRNKSKGTKRHRKSLPGSVESGEEII